MTGVLVDRLGFARDRVELLSGATDDPERSSTRAHVQRDVERLESRARADDIVFIVLDGPWERRRRRRQVQPARARTSRRPSGGACCTTCPGRLVVVNTSGASFPFMADLATRGHIVITATDSVAQRYDTVFPAQLLAALNDPAADLDKNGRVSVWELFVYTARRVARHYEQQGLLATERPLLDDSGDGIGVEAGNDTGTDGALARATLSRTRSDRSERGCRDGGPDRQTPRASRSAPSSSARRSRRCRRKPGSGSSSSS